MNLGANKSNGNTISAWPTKELFIWMLTRDISLLPSIIDLVDNSVDGARNMRGDGPYHELWIKLNLDKDRFRIEDNCGGISVEHARKYAFRFGRDPEMSSVPRSIGEFGVGMKRSLFKLGKTFSVRSTEATSDFYLEVDVNKWAKEEEWEYKFTDYHENVSNDLDNCGTIITVTGLHEDVVERFKLQGTKSLLSSEIRSKLQNALDSGLRITVDGIPIETEPMKLFGSSGIEPAYMEKEDDIDGSKVSTKIYCGVGKSDPKLAGWHIFCNGRLILEADKSRVTGWGEKSGEIYIPGFHGQFNHARGYVFFESDDPGSLPWNTMKTGINEDSKLYRATKPEMIRMMRPVIDMLNDMKDEKSVTGSDDPGPLEEQIIKSTPRALDSVPRREIFKVPVHAPSVKRTPIIPIQRIQYDVNLENAKQVKSLLKARSWKDVGLLTFNYFYENELDESEE